MQAAFPDATRQAIQDFTAFTKLMHLSSDMTWDNISMYVEYRLTHRASFYRTGKMALLQADTIRDRLNRLLRISTFPMPQLQVDILKTALTMERARRQDTNQEVTLQALPLRPATLENAFPRLPPTLQIALYLAMKSASRWDDIFALRWQDIHRITASQVLLVFIRTKPNGDRKRRADHVILIDGHPLPPWADTFLSQGGMPTATPFSQFPWEVVVNALRNATTDLDKPEMTPWDNVRTDYTTHSIKRAAAECLWQAAAQQLIPPELVAHMQKHRNISAMQVPDTTVRYATTAAFLNIARAFRTHEASRAIPLSLPSSPFGTSGPWHPPATSRPRLRLNLRLFPSIAKKSQQ